MSKKILVVEDNADARDALCVILESLGYEPDPYPDGKASLSALDSGTEYCLAMLDIMMPEMNGYEVLEELKNRDHLQDIPVIMVTAKDQESDILEGYTHGADYYITKPYTSKQIEYGIKLFL